MWAKHVWRTVTYHIYISHYAPVSAKTIKKHIEFEDGLDQTTLQLINIYIYISYLPIVHHDSSIFDLNEGYLAGLGSFGVTLTIDYPYCTSCCKSKCCKWAAKDPPTSCHEHFARNDLVFQLWGRLFTRMTRVGTCQDLSRFWSPSYLVKLLRSGRAESHIWFRPHFDFFLQLKTKYWMWKGTQFALDLYWVNVCDRTFLKMRRWNRTTWGYWNDTRKLLWFQQLKQRHQNMQDVHAWSEMELLKITVNFQNHGAH